MPGFHRGYHRFIPEMPNVLDFKTTKFTFEFVLYEEHILNTDPHLARIFALLSTFLYN